VSNALLTAGDRASWWSYRQCPAGKARELLAGLGRRPYPIWTGAPRGTWSTHDRGGVWPVRDRL